MEKEINFKQEVRNLEWARKMYLNELIALLKYNDLNMLNSNKTRALCDIELMIRTMEELKENIK